MGEADLAIVAQEDPAAFGVEGSKLLEAAQLAVGQGCIQLGVQGLGVVPRRPTGMTCNMLPLRHDVIAACNMGLCSGAGMCHMYNVDTCCIGQNYWQNGGSMSARMACRCNDVVREGTRDKQSVSERASELASE